MCDCNLIKDEMLEKTLEIPRDYHSFSYRTLDGVRIPIVKDFILGGRFNYGAVFELGEEKAKELGVSRGYMFILGLKETCDAVDKEGEKD